MSLKDNAISDDFYDDIDKSCRLYTEASVQEAVLEFENYINATLFTDNEINKALEENNHSLYIQMNEHNIKNLSILIKFKKIFGDFEEAN